MHVFYVHHSGVCLYSFHQYVQLLKDSLGGSSKAVVFATVSPALADFDETLSTLRCAFPHLFLPRFRNRHCIRYADRLKNIENKPVQNLKTGLHEQQDLIAKLREELQCLRIEREDLLQRLP